MAPIPECNEALAKAKSVRKTRKLELSRMRRRLETLERKANELHLLSGAQIYLLVDKFPKPHVYSSSKSKEFPPKHEDIVRHYLGGYDIITKTMKLKQYPIPIIRGPSSFAKEQKASLDYQPIGGATPTTATENHLSSDMNTQQEIIH